MQTTSNTIKRPLVALRAGAAIGVGAMLLHWLFDLMAAVVRATLAGAPVRADEALTGLAAGTAALLVLWGVVGVLLVAVGTVPGAMGDAARTASASLTPRLLRRCVGVVLGVGVVAGIAPGVSVATAPATRVLVTARPLPDPGWSAPDDPHDEVHAAGPALARGAVASAAPPGVHTDPVGPPIALVARVVETQSAARGHPPPRSGTHDPSRPADAARPHPQPRLGPTRTDGATPARRAPAQPAARLRRSRRGRRPAR